MAQSHKKRPNLEQARSILRALMRDADRGGRDAGVRALSKSEEWFGLLPDAIFVTGQHPARVVTPLDYLSIAAGAMAGGKGEVLLVNGNLNLTQLEKSIMLNGSEVVDRDREAGGRGILRSLPMAIVRGDVVVSQMESLESIFLTVTRSLKIEGCYGLKSIRGEVFGGAVLRSTGLRRIGADFRAASSLTIFQHPYLETINCEVAGDLTVVSSSLHSTGPAFAAGGGIYLTDCGGFKNLQGVVGGAISLGEEDKEANAGGRNAGRDEVSRPTDGSTKPLGRASVGTRIGSGDQAGGRSAKSQLAKIAAL
jgi:hypothetical protein